MSISARTRVHRAGSQARRYPARRITTESTGTGTNV